VNAAVLTIDDGTGTPVLAESHWDCENNPSECSVDSYVSASNIATKLQSADAILKWTTGNVVVSDIISSPGDNKLDIQSSSSITVSSSISFPGKISFTAYTGITINAAISVTKASTSSTSASGSVAHNMFCDEDNNGGAFIITSIGSITTNKEANVYIRSSEFTIAGAIDLGIDSSLSKGLLLLRQSVSASSGPSANIKIGGTASTWASLSGDYDILDAELGLLTATHVVIKGDGGDEDGTAPIFVAGVTKANTEVNKIQKLTLTAFDESSLVNSKPSITFDYEASVFGCPVICYAYTGITVSQALTVEGVYVDDAGDSIGVSLRVEKKDTGDGVVTIDAAVTITGCVVIKAGDVAIGSSGSMLSSQSDALKYGVKFEVADATVRAISVGTVSSGTFALDGNELQRLTTTGLSLGTGSQTGDITIDSLGSAYTAYISGIFKVKSVNDQNTPKVYFQGSECSFKQLTVEADNGISVAAGTTVKTIIGDLAINGFPTSSSSSSATGKGIHLGAGAVLESEQDLTILSTEGSVDLYGGTSGTYTLKAKRHVNLEAEMAYNAGDVIIEADSDSSGGGTFCMTKAMTNTNVPTTINAADFILKTSGQDSCRFESNGDEIENDPVYVCDASITTGTGALSLIPTVNQVTLGGSAENGFYVDGTEMQALSGTGGLLIGGSTTGDIDVSTLSASNGANINGIVSLMSTKSSGTISIASGYSSPFKTLHCEADGLITISATDISTTTGKLSLKSISNKITSSAAVTLNSAGALTLNAATGIEVTYNSDSNPTFLAYNLLLFFPCIRSLCLSLSKQPVGSQSKVLLLLDPIYFR